MCYVPVCFQCHYLYYVMTPFFYLQGLFVAMIFCFFNGEVSDHFYTINQRKKH